MAWLDGKGERWNDAMYEVDVAAAAAVLVDATTTVAGVVLGDSVVGGDCDEDDY